MESIKNIAARHKMSEGAIKQNLLRNKRNLSDKNSISRYLTLENMVQLRNIMFNGKSCLPPPDDYL